MKKYIFTIIISICSFILYAQQGFVAVGGDIKNGNGSVSLSVGQLDYNSYGNASYLIIEGLQQPSEVSNPLPVTLLYFTAKVTNENTVLLQWSTTSESNNDFFTIERSEDGSNFEKVANVPSSGNSNTKQDYTLTDYKPYQGISYYRLRQTDKDGKFSYSQIEKIAISNTTFSATASPNPTRDIVQLKINEETNKKLNYLLIDINGKVLMKENIINRVTPINLSNLSQGTYILKVMDKENTIQVFKIIRIP
jgi:hypothetical protein